MTRSPKTKPSADPARKQVVIYARVSSKEQEKEGFSIPAQLKLLKEYAANGFMAAQERRREEKGNAGTTIVKIGRPPISNT